MRYKRFEDEGRLRTALLKMPRKDRAIEQRMRCLLEMNGLIVTRRSRQFWVINGVPSKLEQTFERVINERPVAA